MRQLNSLFIIAFVVILFIGSVIYVVYDNSYNTQLEAMYSSQTEVSFSKTETARPTNTPTLTPTFTPTSTPTLTPTLTPTNTPTLVPTNTQTSVPEAVSCSSRLAGIPQLYTAPSLVMKSDVNISNEASFDIIGALSDYAWYKDFI